MRRDRRFSGPCETLFVLAALWFLGAQVVQAQPGTQPPAGAGGFVGDIKDERCDGVAKLGPEAIGISLLAHAWKYMRALAHRFGDRGAADAGGRAGDGHRAIERAWRHYLKRYVTRPLVRS